MIQRIELKKIDAKVVAASLLSNNVEAVKDVLFSSEYFMASAVAVQLGAKGYEIKGRVPCWYAIKDGCAYKLRLASKPDHHGNRRIDIAPSKRQGSERQGFIVWAGVIHPTHYTVEGWSFLEEDIDRSQLKRQSDWGTLKKYLQAREATSQAK